MRPLIFFWRNNEAPDCFNCRNNIIRVIEVTSQLALLFFSDKNEAPHCLFRKESSLALSLQKNAAPHHSFRKNQVSHYLFRKKMNCFFEEIIRHVFFFWRNNEAIHFSEEIMRRLIFSEEIKMCFVLLWRNYKEHFFIWRNK